MKLCFKGDGTVTGVYDDTVRTLLPGKLSVRRASVVTFLDDRQVWQAREVGSGEIIAEHSMRKVCVEMERAVLEERLCPT